MYEHGSDCLIFVTGLGRGRSRACFWEVLGRSWGLLGRSSGAQEARDGAETAQEAILATSTRDFRMEGRGHGGPGAHFPQQRGGAGLALRKSPETSAKDSKDSKTRISLVFRTPIRARLAPVVTLGPAGRRRARRTTPPAPYLNSCGRPQW